MTPPTVHRGRSLSLFLRSRACSAALNGAVWQRPLPCQKMPFRLNFSYICPEPVLVKLIVFSMKWLNKGAFRTNPR